MPRPIGGFPGVPSLSASARHSDEAKVEEAAQQEAFDLRTGEFPLQVRALTPAPDGPGRTLSSCCTRQGGSERHSGASDSSMIDLTHLVDLTQLEVLFGEVRLPLV